MKQMPDHMKIFQQRMIKKHHEGTGNGIPADFSTPVPVVLIKKSHGFWGSWVFRLLCFCGFTAGMTIVFILSGSRLWDFVGVIMIVVCGFILFRLCITA